MRRAFALRTSTRTFSTSPQPDRVYVFHRHGDRAPSSSIVLDSNVTEIELEVRMTTMRSEYEDWCLRR